MTAPSDVFMKIYRSAPSRFVLSRLGVPVSPIVLDRGQGYFPPNTKPLQHEPPITLLPTTTTPLAQQLLNQGATITPSLPTSPTPQRILVDATHIHSPQDLVSLATTTLQPALTRLPKNSRIVLTITTPTTTNPIQSAAHEGVAALTRSLAKELGLYGTTVNLLRLSSSRQDASWPLAFFLSSDSAYITGQEITLTTPSWERKTTGDGGKKKRVALITGAGRGEWCYLRSMLDI